MTHTKRWYHLRWLDVLRSGLDSTHRKSNVQHAFHEMDAMPMNWPYAVLEMQSSLKMWNECRSSCRPATHAAAPTMYLPPTVTDEGRAGQ